MARLSVILAQLVRENAKVYVDLTKSLAAPFSMVLSTNGGEHKATHSP